MPKATEKRKGAGKGKRARKYSPRKSRRVEDEGQSDTQDTQDTQSEREADLGISDAESTTSLGGISETQEEQIAQFFEDRPFFYDKGDPRYKNTKARDAELFEFSKEVGLDRE